METAVSVTTRLLYFTRLFNTRAFLFQRLFVNNFILKVCFCKRSWLGLGFNVMRRNEGSTLRFISESE